MEIFTISNLDGTEIEWVKIQNGDGSCSWMTKAHWDELEAKREQDGTLS